MATANLTVSLDPAVIDMAKAQAAQHGMPTSAWVAKLIRDASLAEASRRYDAYNSAAEDAEALGLGMPPMPLSRMSALRGLSGKADSHNIARIPWVAPIRHGRADIPPYLVALHDADPLGGAVDLDRLRRATPNGALIGLVTGATMNRVRGSIAAVFAG